MLANDAQIVDGGVGTSNQKNLAVKQEKQLAVSLEKLKKKADFLEETEWIFSSDGKHEEVDVEFLISLNMNLMKQA